MSNLFSVFSQNPDLNENQGMFFRPKMLRFFLVELIALEAYFLKMCSFYILFSTYKSKKCKILQKIARSAISSYFQINFSRHEMKITYTNYTFLKSMPQGLSLPLKMILKFCTWRICRHNENTGICPNFRSNQDFEKMGEPILTLYTLTIKPNRMVTTIFQFDDTQKIFCTGMIARKMTSQINILD